MSKRPVEGIDDGNHAYLKRQKISTSVKSNGTHEQIRSGKQLREVLAFDQDVGHSRHGIQSFKTFLDSFVVSEGDNAGRVAIIKDYLESQKPPSEEDKTSMYLADVMQSWSFASQSNDDSLLSAIPAVLALLLRTISNILELSEYGLRLGRTLLQKRQLELIVRGLTVNKTKEFVISPALRLLRELATFDGGTLAKQVFSARDQTFKNLARNLGLRFTGDAIKADAVEDRRKPSVRTNAVRFVLTLIKFLPVDAKREFLNQRDVVLALTRDIKDDPAFMVRELLETLKTYILEDEGLPREAKTKVVNTTSLGRIATLYRYNQPDEESSLAKDSVDTVAHAFLMLACTSADLGVLNRQTGFYPRGVDPDDIHDVSTEMAFIDLGIDSIEWMDKFTDNIPVRNTILSEFIQNLRPWSSTKQTELLISILRSAPELVADYFFGKKEFAFDPKLTATWVGYSALIFSTLQLPIPKYFGHGERYARLPPPTSIVLESILPQPLSQRVLTRCLNQPHKLIKFFGIRLLCVAFSKLQDMLKMYQEAASSSSSMWNQAAARLTDGFCQRCPSIKDIINTFRNTPNTDLLQREAITKLLVLYYEVTPQIALDAKFDVSNSIAQTLQFMAESNPTPEDRAMREIELENLFQFAHFSPGMRWFTKVEGISMSLFIAMLRLSADAIAHIPLVKLRSVLGSIIEENQILQTQTSVSALDSFILGLGAISRTASAGEVYAFLDDCVSRCSAKPIKYIFALEEIQAEARLSDEQQSSVSLLTLAIVEQWPFMVKSVNATALQEISHFVAQHIAYSIKIGEDKRTLTTVIKKLAAEMPQDSPSRKVIERSRRLVDTLIMPEPTILLSSKPAITDNSKSRSEAEKAEITATMLKDSVVLDKENSSLVKWRTKEVEEVIEDGHAAALIMLLSSDHLSLRKEAATSIAKFANKLKESSYEEKEQIWLLLSEVVETAKLTLDQDPLPTVISSFAAHAIGVLIDPLHCLYPKINKFLSQGPVWQADKVPLMYKILDEAPSLDNAHYSETGWLLTYLLAGLRTSADMAIFRKRRVFEKLFSLYNNAYLGNGLRDKILRILFRATAVEGGSTTLITRFSSMTWLQAQVALGGGMPLKTLIEAIFESCDKKRVQTWSKQGANDAKVHALNC